MFTAGPMIVLRMRGMGLVVGGWGVWLFLSGHCGEQRVVGLTTLHVQEIDRHVAVKDISTARQSPVGFAIPQETLGPLIDGVSIPCYALLYVPQLCLKE